MPLEISTNLMVNLVSVSSFSLNGIILILQYYTGLTLLLSRRRRILACGIAMIWCMIKKPLLFFIYLVWTNDDSFPQARTEYLRAKSRAALQSEGGTKEEDDDDDERSGGSGSGVLEHLNLFPLEESSDKKGNEEYLKEKKDEKVMVLLILIPFLSLSVLLILIPFHRNNNCRVELVYCCLTTKSAGPVLFSFNMKDYTSYSLQIPLRGPHLL